MSNGNRVNMYVKEVSSNYTPAVCGNFGLSRASTLLWGLFPNCIWQEIADEMVEMILTQEYLRILKNRWLHNFKSWHKSVTYSSKGKLEFLQPDSRWKHGGTMWLELRALKTI